MSAYLNVPNVDFSGRCLTCGQRVESTMGCTCHRDRKPEASDAEKAHADHLRFNDERNRLFLGDDWLKKLP